MKTQKNILIAFILNFSFAVFEFFGGLFTGSIAIMSDALHDAGDAISIGISYALEKKSQKRPDETHTYGYARYSVLGSLITTTILLVGSVLILINAAKRLFSPSAIHYNGMILFAIIGALVNGVAVFFTHGGHSMNQKAVNLHMIEDALGWILVLIGALVMKFTNFSFIDPVLSILLALFILINALKNMNEILNLFLEKTPKNITTAQVMKIVSTVSGVIDAHHIHLWSLDGETVYATMHIVAEGDAHQIKDDIRHELKEAGIFHATLEFETPDEHCHETECQIHHHAHAGNHHHHHHHHHH